MADSIVLKIDHNVTYVEGKLRGDLYKKLKKKLGYVPDNSFWMVQRNAQAHTEKWRQEWDGTITTICWNKHFCRCHIKKKGIHFHTGLVHRACEFFKKNNVPYRVIDIRKKVDRTDDYSMSDEFEFRDYQQEIIDKVIVGKGIDRGIVKCATGGGKCLNEKSICFTDEGMYEIGEIDNSLGDFEYKEKKMGVYTPLIKNNIDCSSYVYKDGIGASYKITTSYGYSITGTPNHKIKILNKNGDIEWKQLKDICKKDIILISKNCQLFGKDKVLSVDDAYFIGLLYGDGCLTSTQSSVNLTTIDKHIDHFMEKYARTNNLHFHRGVDKRNKKIKRLTIGDKKYRIYLLNLGIPYAASYEKEIPLIIRKSPKKVVAAFLRGLYETDGSVEYDKKGNKITVTIGLSNERLIDQIQCIFLNFGVISSKRVKKTYRRDCFVLTIYMDFIEKFINEIGLDPNGNKVKKLHKYMDECEATKKNSNKDLIPYQYNRIGRIKNILKEIYGGKYKSAYKSKVEESGIKFNTFRSWSGSGFWRVPSRRAITKLIMWIKKEFEINESSINNKLYKDVLSLSDEICEVIDEKYYYDKVELIEEVKSNNYDFVIPKTHSFVANGFISHNTGIACGIIAGIGVSPTIFYVPSIDLLKQAKDEIERFVRYHNVPVKVGMVGGGSKDIQDITVMTIQTAVRALGGMYVKFDDEDVSKDDTDIVDVREEIKNLIYNCKLMICDEIQHWAAETCQIISDSSISCQYRYGFSATPWRDKGDDILIDACFGRCIADISASMLIRKGYLVKPNIYFCTINNMRGMEKVNYQTVYKRAIVENDFRNNKIVEFADYFNSTGRKTLILVRQISHGKLLESLIPDSIFLHGGTSKKKRQEHLDIMRCGKPGVTIASVIFDEGIDCKPLDTLILAGGGKSPTRALQRIGRILRPYEGKKDAIAVDFMDRCRYMEGHSRHRERIYRSEEEFVIERPKGNG